MDRTEIEMKTFLQFCENSLEASSSSGSTPSFSPAFSGKGVHGTLDKVRNLPVDMVKGVNKAKQDADKEKEQLNKEKQREADKEYKRDISNKNEKRKAETHAKKMELMDKQLKTNKPKQPTGDESITGNKDKPKQTTNEVYDPEVQGRSQIRKTGEGGRVGRDRRKSEPERRRMKATGGGKTTPVSYKDRKDIGDQKQAATRVQQPTKERGSAEVKQSYADKVKAERKAAALARRQAKSGGGEVKKPTTSSRDTEKQASKLLTKKTPEKKVSPDYKPAKASGMTRAERMKQQRKGETMLRGIMKDQETSKYKKETGQNPDAKGRTKIMGRVHKRMST